MERLKARHSLLPNKGLFQCFFSRKLLIRHGDFFQLFRPRELFKDKILVTLKANLLKLVYQICQKKKGGGAHTHTHYQITSQLTFKVIKHCK